MDFDAQTFSYRLTALMEEIDMSQVALAKRIDISNVTISRYINGERTPRLDIIIKIAKLFNVSTDYLLGKSDIRNPGKQIDDVLNEAMIGMSKEEYEALTETQKKQIRDFALFVKNQNDKKDN